MNIKRFAFFLVALLLVAPLGIGQDDEPDPVIVNPTTADGALFIGVVTYQSDGRAWELVTNYQRPIDLDLQVYPVPEDAVGTRDVTTEDPQIYQTLVRAASTAADQIAAIDELVGAGVIGIVLTPGPDASDPALAAKVTELTTSGIPVVTTVRQIPGLNLPFHGMDPYEVGQAIWDENDRGAVFALLGNYDDAYQANIIVPLHDSVGFSGFYEVVTSDGYEEAAQAIREIGDDLNHIVCADHRYCIGAVQAVQEVTAGTDRLIQVKSPLGAPIGFRQLFDDDLIQAVITWDDFNALMWAAVNIKVQHRDGEVLKNRYLDARYFGSSNPNSYRNGSWPYSQDNPNRLSRFWR